MLLCTIVTCFHLSSSSHTDASSLAEPQGNATETTVELYLAPKSADDHLVFLHLFERIMDIEDQSKTRSIILINSITTALEVRRTLQIFSM